MPRKKSPGSGILPNGRSKRTPKHVRVYEWEFESEAYHLKDTEAIIDLQDPLDAAEHDDEEVAADRYALELLTGRSEPVVEVGAKRFSAAQLGKNLLQSSLGLRIEPGTLALCYGHSTGDWAKAYGSMGTIYATKQQVWTEVNKLAAEQLDWSAMLDDIALFMRAVLGGVSDDGRSPRQ